MRKIALSLIIAATAVSSALAQTPAATVESAAQMRATLRQGSVLANYPARNIGPTQQGGRIVDLDADPRNAKVLYVAYASGGVWKTTNNGMSFNPIFDEQGTMGIGDIAVSTANPDVLWVGTGECNSSRSSYAGMGVYRSGDAGKTWAHKGLTGTQHISRVVTHPTDVNTAWVASIGALYTTNEDRGVFKTTDGGATWRKTLYINPETGVIDLAIDPKDPNHLLAAAWQRSRKAWEFDEDGPSSGIYESKDGGETWLASNTGLPSGEKVGRYGLAFAPSDPKIVYAVLDNQDTDPKLQKEDTIGGITARALAKMTQADVLALADSNLDKFLKESGFPEKYKASGIKNDLKAGKYTVKDVAEYFGDANAALFNTAVKGAELYRSNDGGSSWTRTHSEALKDVYYTYGYYFGMMKVAPDNPEEAYIAGVPCLRTRDGGKTWKAVFDADEIHVDHHVVWLDPRDPEHIVLGNDGGLYESYDRAENVRHLDNVAVGQFYTVAVDMEKPYNVYGGLQDNGVQKGSSKNVAGKEEDWEYIFGGDGMCVAPDIKNPKIVYTGFQFGNYYRLEEGGESTAITPKHDIGEDKYRWNWRTPLIRSPHNHEIIYMGAQYVFRSLDMGNAFERISPDLTTYKQPQGNVPFSTITALAESPLKFGLLWAGTDDGNVQVTTDAGTTWANVSSGLPKGLWVSYISPSPHDKATAFVTLTGYRNDDFAFHAFKTTDLGKTWFPLKGNLPEENANVLIEDPEVRDVLYLGTDQGCYASLDGGANWMAFGKIPNVATYDMVVHPREPELVVATHGRSIYIVELKELRAAAKRDATEQLMVFAPNKIKWRDNWGKAPNPFTEARQPKMLMKYLVLGGNVGGVAECKVLDAKGKAIHQFTVQAKPGYNELEWNLLYKEKGKDIYLGPGTYSVVLKLGAEEKKTELKVEK
jgi:photosystem II stability/assembly factor-like uncharacterized protein